MSATPRPPSATEDTLLPLSILGLRAGEPVPGIQELCRLAGLSFGVSMFAVTWLRDTSPIALWSSGLDEPLERILAQWSRPAIQSDELIVLHSPDDAIAAVADGDGRPAIGFFAAATLTLDEGIRVGALCIADAADRPFSPDHARSLRDFATVASEALRGRKTLADTRRREQLLARAFRLAKVGGWEYNVITGTLTLSEQALEIYGMDPATQPTLDMMMRRFYPGDSLIDTREDFTRLIREGKGYDSRRRIQLLNGSSRWIHVLAEPEEHEGQIVRVHGLVEDITEEVESQRRLHELAYTDKLTGLPNRSAFLLELGRHFSRRDPVVLTSIDIDGFKDVNDSIGHHAGDQLLTELGQRIAAYFPVGTFVARVGSNEFIVIADEPVAPGDSIVAQVERLRLQLKEPVHYAEHALAVSVSVGLCEAPTHARDADQLIRSTDIALYQAKKAGGDRTVVFEPDMRNKLEERVQLLRDVRRGIERKEFILYYQPIKDMQTQELSGFEALMRWSLSEKGILTPCHFEAAFADQTLGPQLGNEALRSAFAQMRAWVDRGFDFKRVSVNIAAVQFSSGDLASHILYMLKEYGIRPDQLTLEITESVYLGPGTDGVEAALRTLHDAGTRIALDDFGTGYASLSQLQRFPIDSLKIDRSFVQNPGAASIVDAILALGNSLNMQVVAEGVESQAHQQELLRRGCRYGQGYYLGKPMPAEFYP